MSFKLVIYYCALGGGWAAFLTWGIVQAAGMRDWENKTAYTAVTGAILGCLIAATIGVFDALLNSVGFPSVLRVITCEGIALGGGALRALAGNALVVAMNAHAWGLILRRVL